MSMATKEETELNSLKEAGFAPYWLTVEGYRTLKGGYLLDGETPRDMWVRISGAAAHQLGKPELGPKFFDLFWKNWLCPATPVASNLGTDRGLPISCYSNYFADSIDGIMRSSHELAMLSKNGGGVGCYFGDIRPQGSIIRGNGTTDGIVPFMKIVDSVTIGVSQGGVRRGATAIYLPIDHGDINDFLNVRRPQGDVNRQCLNIHHGVTVPDSFMEKVMAGDKDARALWGKIIKTRFETGEPYIMFSDTVNRNRPAAYINNNLEVKTSNLCSEITLYVDEDHTFVCCLSSMNLAKWDEWKDTDAVYYAVYFLEGVMSEFIEKASNMPGLDRAVAFAKKSRALGLGALGFHTYLQENNMPFGSFEAYNWNNLVFSFIKRESIRASQDLAKEYGEPEWCKGTGMRHTHLRAVAPTASNSIISGNVSPGIEPIAANAFNHKTSKGLLIQRNPTLKRLLASLGKDTPDVWKSIVRESGSVQHLDFLTDEQKQVFLTARELNQFDIVRLAAARQKHLDQTQSLNLFFPANASMKYVNEVHLEAWKQGIQTLYYCRSSAAIKADAGSKEYVRKMSECTMCEG